MTKHTISPTPAAPALEGSLRAAADRLDTLRSRLADLADETKQRSQVLAEHTKDLVAARPLTAVAIAAGAGYLAMRIATSALTQLAVVGGLLYFAGGVLRK